MSPAFDVMEFLPLMILNLSWCFFKCDVYTLPDFQPNDYLFETHADKGKERWEVYAWALRDVMARAGGFDLCDTPIKTKMNYESHMQMISKELPSHCQGDIESQSHITRHPSQ